MTSGQLDFQGVVQTTTLRNKNSSEIQCSTIMQPSLVRQMFMEALATCHSLQGSGGQVDGYPLDKATFVTTGYVLDSSVKNVDKRSCKGTIQSPDGSKTLLIRKIFRFDASLQKSSVIVENHSNQQQMVYTKGSPDAIFDICDLASVPQSYFDTVRTYTSQGYYCIAYASKAAKYQDFYHISREDVEVGLTFLGFALFQVLLFIRIDVYMKHILSIVVM